MITYKNITDVEVLNEMPEGAKVMVNDSGELKQAALDLKALDYNNLTKVEAIEELPENAKVLVNDGGKLKQVACGAFGGGGSILMAYNETTTDASCGDTTYEEFVEILNSGILPAIIMTVKSDMNNSIKQYYCSSINVNDGYYSLEFYSPTNGGSWKMFTWNHHSFSVSLSPA